MGFGEPKIMPTPGEMAKMQQERTLSDAELIKEGSEYASDEDGDLRLDVTEKQKIDAQKEHASEKYKDLAEHISTPDINGLESEEVALKKWYKDELEKCSDNYEKRLVGAEKAYSNPQEVKNKKDEITTRFFMERNTINQEYDERKAKLAER